MFSAPVGVDFQISLLLFVSLLGYFLATRVGQSVVIGEILVGVLVGPSVLRWITYTDFVSALAGMGAVFLLFVIGLQTKFKEIYTKNSFVIAFFGVIVPWLGGFLLARAFGYPDIEAVFVGTALTATSIAITAHVLKELKKLDSTAAKAIIGAAVIDDVLGLLALGLTNSFVAQKLSLNQILFSLVAAVAFIALGVFIGTRFLTSWLEKWDAYAVRHGVPQSTLIAAIAVAFAYATVSELIGLSAVVGAFVAGVSLESLKIKSYREGTEYFENVFAAIFFVSLGVLIDVASIATSFAFLIALTIVAVATKLIGCGIGARLAGLSVKDSLIVGVGMFPRGEVAMIVALIGLNAGLIGQEIYSAVLLMSLLTTIATPLWLKELFAAA